MTPDNLKNSKKTSVNPGSLDWYISKINELKISAKDPDFAITALESEVLKLVDKDLSKKIPSDSVAENESLKKLSFVAAVFGITPELIESYNLQEFIQLYSDEQKRNFLRIIRSFKELSKGDTAKEFAESLVDIISSKSNQKLDEWESDFFLLLSLHLIYQCFPKLKENSQKNTLENYFYKAIEVGVPVRSILGSFLHQTRDSFEYVLGCKFIVDELNKNAEQILVDSGTGAKKSLSGLLKDYLSSVGDDWLNEKKQEVFVKNIYVSQKDKDKFVAIKEVVSIYSHLKNADLIKQNAGGELNEADSYSNDFILLITWFGIGDVEDLINYFIKAPRVPLSAFIVKLKEISDLSQQITIENILELAEALHKKGLLDTTQELLVYFQQDNQFHWNESAIK